MADIDIATGVPSYYLSLAVHRFQPMRSPPNLSSYNSSFSQKYIFVSI